MTRNNLLKLVGVFIIVLSLSPTYANAELTGVRDSKSYIGSWGSGYDPFGDPSVQWASFTLYPDNYYIYWESRNGSEVEYGTYSYDPVSQYMTFNPTYDENVNEGPNGTDGNVIKIVVSEDIMTIGEGGEAFSLKRVKAQYNKAMPWLQLLLDD